MMAWTHWRRRNWSLPVTSIGIRPHVHHGETFPHQILEMQSGMAGPGDVHNQYTYARKPTQVLRRGKRSGKRA